MRTTLPRYFYSDPDFYRAELERFYCTRWICAGRVDQVPASGDYVTTVPSRRAFADAALTFARRPRSRLVVVRLRAADLSDLARRVEAGLLRPVIDRVVGLADAVEGVRHLESRHAHGKVVVRVA